MKQGGLSGSVQVIEHLGAETYVFVDIGGARDLCWRTPGWADVAVGDRVTLGFDVARLHVFDPETGARIEI